MKGFSHFVMGIAVSTFFPQAVHMATQEQSFVFCLGGISGIMTGRCVEFVKRADGASGIVVSPWHHTWGKGLTLGFLASLVVGLIAYLTVPEGPHPELYSIPRWCLYPLIVFCASLVHCIEDSAVLLADSLIRPVTPDRTSDIPIFLFLWTAFMTILFNLDRLRWAPEVNAAGIPSAETFLFWFIAVPFAVMIYFFLREKRARVVSRGGAAKGGDFDGTDRGRT